MWQAKQWLIRGVSIVFALCMMFFASMVQAEEEFLEPEQAFQLAVAMASPTEIDVHFTIAPSYYMYQSRFAFALNEKKEGLGEAHFPPAIRLFDITFNEEMEVYRQQVTVRVPLESGYGVPGVPLSFSISYQGCADAGLCYSPLTETISLQPTTEGYKAQGQWVKDHVPAPLTQAIESPVEPIGLAQAIQLSDTGVASYLAQVSWGKMLLLAFVFGLLLSFTPCVLPMVPILLSIIAGQQTTPTHQSRWRGLSLAAAYVLGMSLVYTLLGVVAGLAGASLAVWLQTPWVLMLFAGLLAILALSMFDVYTLQVPTGMQSALQGRLSSIPGGQYGGVFVMGMLSALIVGPCVAAPLAGVLLFISQTGDVVLGGSTLFALAWGSGTLLLVVGATSGMLLPKAGTWMEGIKYAFGVLLLATAWWMMNSILPDWLMVLGWVVLLLWSAVMLGVFSSVSSVFSALRKAIGIVLLIWSALVLVGFAMGSYSLLQPLSMSFSNMGTQNAQLAKPTFNIIRSVEELDQQLAATNKPVMLDFYADWCVACIEMEKFTFSEAHVAQKMESMLLLKADVTKNTAEDRALLKRFNLFGPPGIIFFDAKGQQVQDPRVVGFMPAPAFAAELDKMLK